MSGRRSRNKGARVERGIVHAPKTEGFAAVRVPLSGAVGGRFAGDIVMWSLRENMPRPLQRVRLENGLKLELNKLARLGVVRPGAQTGAIAIVWTNSYGEQIASGLINSEMNGRYDGWFQIQMGQIDQRISLITQLRHFGGQQWYFVCPYTHRLSSVLWKPPGAKSFASRQAWGRQVAYASQFLDRTDRAHHGQAKIKSRLCSIGGFNPDEWDFPPKPKWMRWSTYNRAEESFDRYEAILDEGTLELVARFKGLV